jgi:hypothetical protein
MLSPSRRGPEARDGGVMTTKRRRTAAIPTTVDDFLAGLPDEQRPVVAALRRIVIDVAPQASEGVKWGMPVYDQNGVFCYISAHREHVNLGFYRGSELPDPEGVLEGGGGGMRHVKIRRPDEIREPVLRELVEQAARLNQSAPGAPAGVVR